jgi:SAM-dependent methyltransferase
MHQSSFEKMLAFKNRYLAGYQGSPLQILDLGSQDINGSYRPIFDDPAWCYVGLDLSPGNNVDIVLNDPYLWKPVRSASFDVVISGQALEHIEFFWLTMLEVARALKPGGLACIIAPSAGPEHRYPVDCWRFYTDGMKALADFAQLDVHEVTTQWQDGGYADGSDWWHDSMLVCRKPDHGVWWNMKSNLKRRLRHWVLR